MGFGPGFSAGFSGGHRPNPFAVLNSYMERESWFEGTVMAVVFFEAWGKDSIRLLFKKNNLPLPTILENAQVGQVISALREFDLISDKVEKKMRKVNNYRVELVHREKPQPPLSSEVAKPLINDALDVMDVLAPRLKRPETQK